MSHLNERLAIMGGHSIEGEAEQILIGLGFDHNDMNRQMNEFSNGWQMRVELARFSFVNPNYFSLTNLLTTSISSQYNGLKVS
jgi:ATP-binding cassette subfamily F protein 3